jgi:hypothetical protein
MKATTHVMLAVALAGALLLACGGEEETTTPTAIVNDSPANCLKVIAASWNGKNYNRFRPCLSPDFVFYFNPNDVGASIGGYEIPVSWNYTQMTAAVKNMFEQAYDIEMAIPTSTVGKPGSGATTWRANNIIISMTLYTAPGTGYRIGAGYCNFAFEKYEENNEARWRLTSWWDFSREGSAAAVPGVEPSSLGRVLSLYR